MSAIVAAARAGAEPLSRRPRGRRRTWAAAGVGGEPLSRRPRGRRRTWRPILAAAAATLLLPVGLAFAGVSLPGAVERSYRAVGIELPDQARDAQPPPTRRQVTPHTPTPTSTTAKPARPRPAEQRPRHARAGDGRNDRAKRADPAGPAGRRDKSRVSRVRPAPGRHGGAKNPAHGRRGATGSEHRPASRTRPSGRPRRGRPNRPTSPRTTKAGEASNVRRTGPPPGAGRPARRSVG